SRWQERRWQWWQIHALGPLSWRRSEGLAKMKTWASPLERVDLRIHPSIFVPIVRDAGSLRWGTTYQPAVRPKKAAEVSGCGTPRPRGGNGLSRGHAVSRHPLRHV